ncbi:hypothetical protein niasHS_012926 [Heterodera schachtii]|uniref:Tyrosinase copper-binding domain-containing protein n=1 Tax=Heterodera schachtii TaxID=97005 RepID=A0ABD2ICH7_HETSC
MENSDHQYQLAQIVPPGKYRLILWDKLSADGQSLQNNRWPNVGDRSLCHRDEIFCFYCAEPDKLLFYTDVIKFRLNELEKCFVHFYTAETDERGHFLVYKMSKNAFDHFNLYILPLKNSLPISGDDFVPYAEHKIIVKRNLRKNLLPNSFDPLNLVEYFEMSNDWKMNVLDLLNHWLSDDGFSYELSEKQNFFLIANFKYLVDYAEQQKIFWQKMETTKAQLLGIFWDFFSEAANANLLWKRLRFADQQILELVDQFCRIDKQYLLSHSQITLALRNVDNAMAFCQNWLVACAKAANAMQTTIVMDAFSHWIYSGGPPLNGANEIVHFWIELFSKRTATNDIRRMCRWPEIDQSLFRRIGILFVEANKKYALKLKILEKIKGVRQLLDQICANVNHLSLTCCAHNSLQIAMDQWKTTVCPNGQFRYLLQPKNKKNKQSAEMVLYQNRQLPPAHSNQQLSTNKCAICLSEEPRFAMDPCGHQCACGQLTATTTVPKGGDLLKLDFGICDSLPKRRQKACKMVLQMGAAARKAEQKGEFTEDELPPPSVKLNVPFVQKTTKKIEAGKSELPPRVIAELYACLNLTCLCNYFEGESSAPDQCLISQNSNSNKRQKRKRNQRYFGKALRMEYRMLSDQQRLQFHNALLKLKHGRDSYEYDRISFLHSNPRMMLSAHSGPTFLLWHREYLKR